MKNILLIVHG